MPQAVKDTIKLAALFVATIIMMQVAVAIWASIGEKFAAFPG